MAAFVHRHRVAYHECDAQGHVFNANAITFVDVALTELWRARLGSYGAMLDAGVDLVVAEVGMRFLAPMPFDALLDVALEITRLGRTGMTTATRLSIDGTTCAEGTIRHVYVAAGGTRPTPVPGAVREALAPHLAAGADGAPAG